MNEEHLLDSIRGLEGIEITLYLEDNKNVEGTLLSVQSDHLIVKVKDKILYFPINQIKALSKSAKDSRITRGTTKNVAINRVLLEELLDAMQLQWITVNSIDDQKFSGVLSFVAEDYILLLNGEKQYFILKSRITDVLNEQVDENQIEELQSNQLMESINTVTNEVSMNPVNSNLQQPILNEQQRIELANVARRKFSRLTPPNAAQAGIEAQLKDAQLPLENESNLEIENDEMPTGSENIELENESNLETENESILAVSEKTETEHDLLENESNLEIQNSELQQQTSSENETTKQIASSSTKKTVKTPFLKELKYNSPLKVNMWNEEEEESSVFSFPKSKKDEQVEMTVEPQEELQETTDTIQVKDKEEQENPIERKNAEEFNGIQHISGELVTVEQDQEEYNEDFIDSIVMEEEDETTFEHGPIKMLMEDNRHLLKCQYYALMKFAERMHHLENQYKTIMKHAEKMYLQLKDRRYY